MLRVPPGLVQSAVGDSSEKSLDTTEPDEELLTPTWPAVSTRPNTPSPTPERSNSPSPNPQIVDHAWSPEEDTLWRLWEYGGALTLRTPEDTQTEFARAKSSDAAAIGAVAATGRVPSSRFDPVPSPRFGSQELQRNGSKLNLRQQSIRSTSVKPLGGRAMICYGSFRTLQAALATVHSMS